MYNSNTKQEIIIRMNKRFGYVDREGGGRKKPIHKYTLVVEISTEKKMTIAEPSLEPGSLSFLSDILSIRPPWHDHDQTTNSLCI